MNNSNTLKWKVEYITNESSNILIGINTALPNDALDVVGMGFPPALAERIVQMHNEAIDKVERELKE